MKNVSLVGVFVLLLSVNSLSQTWTIGNKLIERQIVYDATYGLFTDRLSDLATHSDLILHHRAGKAPAAEFSFTCNGESYEGASASFKLVTASVKALPNGKELSIMLRSTKLPLEVEILYASYEGHPAIRKWLVFRNTGSAILHLSHLNIESISPSVGPSDETILNAQYGAAPREIFYTGRSEDAGLLIANSKTGHGFAVLSEVPGYMKRTEVDGFYNPGRIGLGVMYDTDLMPFERALRPGTEFTTAAVSLLTFRNGDGFNDPHWVLPSYTSEVLQRRIGTKGAPWIYNTWNPFKRSINREIALQLIDVAGKMGVDIFTIDDGWQQEYGNNLVDPIAFPGGLDPIIRSVEAKGMRLGLWIPLAAIGKTSSDFVKHPEWAATDQAGEQKFTSTFGGSKVVMCMASPFRDAAAERINDAIERFHLAYVKLDLTTIFNTYGEAPGCWAKGHDHGNWAESLSLIYEGISHVTRRVYEKHPDVLIDLTFELWGQKHLIDAGLLSAGDLDWMSNVGDMQTDAAGPIQIRTLLYQRAISMPVESMLIGNPQATMHPPAVIFATAIGSAPLFLGDLRKLSPADQHWYKDHIDSFRKFREQNTINESFFPLGSWRQPRSTEWDGFARLARSGSGVIALFQNHSGSSDAFVQLPLIPDGSYRVRSIIDNKDLGVITKEAFVHGVRLPFAAMQQVNVIEVVRAKQQ